MKREALEFFQGGGQHPVAGRGTGRHVIEAFAGCEEGLVEDDGVTDYLTGSAGNDWYFARTSGTSGTTDVLSGNSSQDAITPI